MNTTNTSPDINRLVTALLEQLTPRQRDPIALYFGLFGPRLNTATIADELSTTHQNVRQVIQTAMERLHSAIARDADLQDNLAHYRVRLQDVLSKASGTLRVSDLPDALELPRVILGVARIIFIIQFIPQVGYLPETAQHRAAVTTLSSGILETNLKKLSEAARHEGKPAAMATLAEAAGIGDPAVAEAIAHVSKLLGEQDSLWGLSAWPAISPKALRDRIYLVLKRNGNPMHFSEIIRVVREDLDKDVSEGGIHNELIWDDRFAKVGRGIYALKELGYTSRTIKETIADVLREANGPLTIGSIVKQVLERRHGTSERTIRLVLSQCSKTLPQVRRLRPGVYVWHE